MMGTQIPLTISRMKSEFIKIHFSSQRLQILIYSEFVLILGKTKKKPQFLSF